jgi:glycosyltransferase involved in cell wall biosynthesis
MKNKLEKVQLAVVVPLYNEEENVVRLYEKIHASLRPLQKSYEIILVDDGSTDRTFEILEQLKQNDPFLRVIKFRGNFGQSAATAAGFDLARGEVIITMDGDLQNDPSDIPRILEKLEQGYDVVSGWRKSRKDKLLLRKVPSKIANRIICKVTDVQLHDTGCALKAYRAEIVKRLNLYGELHRFLPALARIEGAKIAEMEVQHHPRLFGASKYNLTRTYKVLMDLMSLHLFIRYLQHPAHFFGIIGAALIFLAMALTGWMFYEVLMRAAPQEEFNNLLTIAFLFFAAGFQMFFVGLLAELIVKTGQRREVYLLDRSAK